MKLPQLTKKSVARKLIHDTSIDKNAETSALRFDRAVYNTGL
jgi:hypothetical protein